jgi:hypothetical protein
MNLLPSNIAYIKEKTERKDLKIKDQIIHMA